LMDVLVFNLLLPLMTSRDIFFHKHVLDCNLPRSVIYSYTLEKDRCKSHRFILIRRITMV
jgi:hypothetical protein